MLSLRGVRLLPLPALLLTVAGVVLPGTAAAAAECGTDPRPGQVESQTPVEQLVLGARRAWPTSTGQGVTVAVLDTGVDNRHPQLRGAVPGGWDFVEGEPGGTVDCAGHGTAIAGLVAARRAGGVGFAGIAPGATILPVRVAERAGAADTADPAVLAAAIRWAADRGAAVIAVPLVAERGTDALRTAVAYAQSRDALVVAAAGTRASTSGDATGSDPTTYPAGYEGVLGVGAVDAAGARLGTSPLGSYVDIVAPGSGLVSTAVRRGHTQVSGTGPAAALVAGTAALVRAAQPGLRAGDVRSRLVATANPVPGGAGSAGYGGGMADPYRAVTEVLPGDAARAPAGMPLREVDEESLRRDARWRSLAASAVAIAASVVLLLAGCAAVFALHRRLRRGHPPAPSEKAPATVDTAGDPAEVFFTPPGPPRPQ